MRGSGRRLVVALAIVLAAVVGARAADTGSVSGVVFDREGRPVAEVTVKISGDRLPAGRTVATGVNGTYRFEYLLAGEYLVEVEKAGVGNTKRGVIVEIGKDTQLDAVIGLTVSEEVTVTAASPIVDTRSAEVSFNFKSATFNNLPLERTYRGIFQLIPGIADNRSPVGPAAGGGRQDNTYLIDGANITNPGFGYLSTEVNELDIAEVNLKRAGISAEFGRTSGTVTNAVSRSGTNQLFVLGRLEWLPKSLVNQYELPDDLIDADVKPGAFRDPLLTVQAAAAAGVGGPVVKDHIFFYGSSRYAREAKWGRVNKVGTPLPNEIRKGPEVYGKLTAIPTTTDQLTVSYRRRPNHVENAALTSDFAPSAATTRDNGSEIATAEWAHFPGPRSSFSVRYLYMNEHNEDVPVRDLGYLPAFNPGNLSAMGQYTDPNQANLTVGGYQFTNIQNYRRHEVRGSFSHLMDLAGSSHAFSAGVGYEFADEKLARIANGWGLIASLAQNGVPVLRARYFTPQVPQIGGGSTYSIFVQDDVAVTKRVAANVGVLLNRDEFSQYVAGSGGCPATITLKGGAATYESRGDTCAFLRFGFRDEIQPRLGLSYEVRAGKGDKLYGSWGRYYNMDQKSSGRSLAPSRIFQTETVFDLNGNVLSSGPLASTTGKLIDPDIKPIHTDEIAFGYATPFGGGYSLDVFFMSRQMRDFIEDLPSRQNGTAPNSGPFVAANLPCKRFAACQSADARRTYRAFTVDVRRRLANRWMGDVNYTWSRFEGNYDTDYSLPSVFATVFNTSSFIQDGPGTNVEDPNRFGPLFEDRPHLFKVFTTFEATRRLTLSGYFRLQSGTPWAARGRDWPGAALNFLEPSGAHRNPAWANLDVLAAYKLPLSGRASITFEGRLLNVFNNQTQLSTDAQQFLDLRMTSTPPFIAPYLQPNPFFATGNSFAPPRRLHLAAVIGF